MYIKARVENDKLFQTIQSAMDRLYEMGENAETKATISLTFRELKSLRRMILLEEAQSSLLFDSIRKDSLYANEIKKRQGKDVSPPRYEHKPLVFKEDELHAKKQE